MKKVIHTDDAPEAIGTYSQAVLADKFLFISGQIGLDPTTMELVEGFEEETIQVFRNVSAICKEAGLPNGVVNILTGDGTVGEKIVTHTGIDKVAFTGSTAVGRHIRQAIAGQGKEITLELGGKSPYIVFDDADIDSAVEGLVDAIWLNQGQVCCAGSRLFVQEGSAEVFHRKLRARMDKLRMGNPLDKSIDIGAIVDPTQLDSIHRLVDEGLKEGGNSHVAAIN